MNDQDFGLGVVDHALFNRVLREGKKSGYFTARQHLYQAYETAAGVFNHLLHGVTDDAQLDPDLKRPLSSVAMHFAEDTTGTSILNYRWNMYKDKKVFSISGLNWLDFLSLPRDQVEMILESCSKQNDQEAKINAEVARDFPTFKAT